VARDEIHGLTAAYALDALDEREQAEYEAHLDACSECRAELASLQGAAASIAYAPELPAPPPELRQRILAQARSERENVVPPRRRWVVPAAGLAAAVAACAALALGLWAASLRSSLAEEREAASELAALVDAERIPLEGVDGAVLVGRNGEATLVVRGLDEAPEGKLYEAWVSADGETMLPAGTFDAEDEQTIFSLTRPLPPGGLVAVTLEDRPVDEPQGEVVFTSQTA
jgi:anti-sigma factor RsiW